MTLIIAEAGVNHNGNLHLAKKLALKAKEAGADIVKYQMFVPEKLVTHSAEKAEYQKESTGSHQSQLDMLKKLALSKDEFVELKIYCEEINIKFLSTAFDMESVDTLHEMGCDLWKIPSGEITNLPYLRRIASFGQQVIMSTGMATMEEIENAIQVLKDNGAGNITALHCTTAYPAPYEQINLKAMLTLKDRLKLPVGYSDHSKGICVSCAAAALGAVVLEKHFTLDRTMKGPDHKASLEPDELKAMVESVHAIESALGDGDKVPTKLEIENSKVARKSQVQRKVYNGLVGGILTPERIAKLDKLGMRWESMSEALWKRYYNACVEYKEKFGDLSPARTFVTDDGIRLGAWIGNLRTNRRSGIKNGFLTDERVAALDELGMVWEIHDFMFEKFYYSAVRYLEEHGNLDVPSQYVDENGNRLGVWIDKNRKYYREKNPNLTAEEIERLNSIGMMWEKRYDRIWRVQYEELVKYKKRFGDVKVPLKYITETGVKLGEWLNDQFAKYKIKRMPREREEKLRALGVVLEREDPWEERFKLAKAYYEQHHTLSMPGIYNVNGICLSKWVNEQKQIIRGKRKGKSLTPEQIKRLESIGFTMKKQSEIVWEQKYSEVRDHYTKNGRVVVPEKTESRYGGDLHVWLTRQTLSYRKGDMRSDRAEKFKRLGAVD